MEECKAVVFSKPYELEVRRIEIPIINDDQVLIQTHACGLCMREIHVYTGILEREFPSVMGHEIVGIVKLVGENVKNIKKGDMVTAITNSGLAEYCVSEGVYTQKIKKNPNDPIYNYIAEPLMCCIAAVRKAELNAHDRVMVIGAGFMGNLLAQVLKKTILYNKICVVDIKLSRLELVRNYGISKTINLSDGNSNEINEDKYDVVFEASGSNNSIEYATKNTRNGGKLCVFGHHFNVENETVNEWHLRGINVLNTVPWASDNLELDFRNAAYALNNKVYCYDGLITHIYHLDEVEKLFNDAITREKNYMKGILLLK